MLRSETVADERIPAGECLRVPLASLGALRARGRDVVSFLQGQLSNDMTRLAADHSVFAGYHNPQGRVVALLRLLQLAPDDVLAILPRELVTTVAQRLAKFILRAKVKLADESADWTVTGLTAGAAGTAGTASGDRASGLAALLRQLPATADGSASLEGSYAVRLPGPGARWLVITPRSTGEPPALAQCAAGTEETWRRGAIAAGEPEVVGATSEEFVAQMLNLDALGAIAFDKGCYIGQEVIARAHYRGRVKRRLQRFRARRAPALGAGEAGELADGRPFRVVSAVTLPDGACEFLAVAPVSGAAIEGGAAPARPETRLDAVQLALPYSIPE